MSFSGKKLLALGNNDVTVDNTNPWWWHKTIQLQNWNKYQSLQRSHQDDDYYSFQWSQNIACSPKNGEILYEKYVDSSSLEA